ncbi:MAG: hypothetical protein U9O66_03780 [Patescibacteria group bacterium]|nr:hypothetical protein [Patescibacteria group bacterium]
MSFENQIEQEKTKEQLLEEFKNSLEKYGVKEAECRLEQDGELVIEQKLNHGIHGLGYDNGSSHEEGDKRNNSLWLCLDQSDPETIKKNQEWNKNTILDFNNQISGLIIKKTGDNIVEIRISNDHPISTLSRLIDKQKSICLPSDPNGWKLDNMFEADKDTGELVSNLEWDGEEPIECKVAILDTPCDWKSGKWRKEASQKLVVKN